MPLFGRKKPPPPPDAPAAPSAPSGEDEAPGWDAITAAVRGIYGDAKEWHVGYGPAYPIGPNLQGCSAYAAGDHWHFVTYGLSALFVPDSGWGVELTFRLKRGDEAEPPRWAFALLNNLAVYVNTSERPLLPAERMDAKGPITGGADGAPATSLTGFAFTLDPQLPPIVTPFEEVAFVQVVGITNAERERMVATDTDSVLAELSAGNPLLVTDLSRAG